jgi:hypothetical protein
MLEIYELLDRFELLYPTNIKLSDLRRSYIDQDLFSIFRLLPNDVTGNIEDLRKAVIEKNLHSIFRLTNDEDLRKLILDDNIWKLWPVLERHTDTQFVAAFKNIFSNNITYNNDCFSRGQLQSKIWLIQELKKLNLNLGTVFLCAGWYATLSVMLFESGIKIDKIRSFDLDSTTVDIAEIFNKPWFMEQWKFKALVNDIHSINYDKHTWQCWSNANNRMSYPITDVPTAIINTSCEHIENFKDWYSKIPNKKLVILQSNNYFEIAEHVNCSSSLEEFSNSCPMSTVLYQGELVLPKYTRFMKIGYK